jgi:hypothetical protein
MRMMMCRRIGVLCLLAALAGGSLAACGSGGGGSATSDLAGPTSASSPTRMPSISSTPTGLLDGEWHMRYSCEEEVRTFQRNIYRDQTESVLSDGRSPAELLKAWSGGFAWGPSAKTATELTPEALCKGAHDREHIMRIAEGNISEDPGTVGLVGTIEFVNDHTIAVSDGHHNIDDIDTFVFLLRGDKLTLTQKAPYDSWQGTQLEEAPWYRSS